MTVLWALCAAILQVSAALTVSPPTPLDFGNYSFPIADQAAQTWFDQGLMHLFGFNYHEALAAFTECETASPAQPMCTWGLAMASGPNLNHATLSTSEVAAAHSAATRAQKKASIYTLRPKQAALVEIISIRYPSQPDGDQVGSFALYASRMQQAAEVFPDDADILAWAAEAQMDLCRRFYHGYFPIETMDKPQGGFVPRGLLAKSMLESALLHSGAHNAHKPTVS